MSFSRCVVFAITACGAVLAAAAVEAADKLTLSPEMVINETGLGDGSRIVDEQEAVGSPKDGPGPRPESAYLTGWKEWMFPASLIVDLGPDQDASQLLLFNESGQHTIQVSTGSPTAWLPPTDLKFDRYREWHAVNFEKPTRYVRITFIAPTSLAEIVAYGTRREPPPVATAAARTTPRPTFDQFLGTNGFIDDPIDKLVPVTGTLREYHGIGWDFEAADHLFRIQPSGAAGGNLWFFDDYYRQLHQAGVTVAPCLQQSLPWVTGSDERDAKPALKGTDSSRPAAYAAHAAHMFQFAARYGSRAVPDEQLQLAGGQPRVSGLGLIRFFENANEPDKNWKERLCMSTPFEFAAQCSADYDGHQGALGAGHGIRTADPEAKMVMGGLYRIPLTYLNAMRFWAEHYRGGSFPADVINVHHYCGDGDEQQAFKTKGLSPEEGDLRGKMTRITQWRDRYVPNAEVWVTEFGWDTNPGSPLHAPAIGSLSAETVQAAWLARSNFLLAAAGVDRATMFMFRDTDEKSPNVFATCGLVTAKGRWEPKPAWYMQAALKKHLAGMHFQEDLPVDRKEVAAMRFAGNGREAIAVWCTTSKDQTERGVRLPWSRKSAKQVNLVGDNPAGRVSKLMVNDDSVTVDVSEIPSLIIVE